MVCLGICTCANTLRRGKTRWNTITPDRRRLLSRGGSNAAICYSHPPPLPIGYANGEPPSIYRRKWPKQSQRGRAPKIPYVSVIQALEYGLFGYLHLCKYPAPGKDPLEYNCPGPAPPPLPGQNTQINDIPEPAPRETAQDKGRSISRRHTQSPILNPHRYMETLSRRPLSFLPAMQMLRICMAPGQVA